MAHYSSFGYKGGIPTRKNTMSKLQEWSSAVKNRDQKCMECGKTEDLHAHHIKHKSSHPELSLDVDNGKTLCYSCHKAEHETNRSIRVRGNLPQRRTLIKRIAALEQIVLDREKVISDLRHVVKRLNRGDIDGSCIRGSCPSGIELSRMKLHGYNSAHLHTK